MNRVLSRVVTAVGLVVAVAGGLYAWNTAPDVPTIPAAESARGGKPYVIKLHAQWCPKCLVTKGAWSELQAKYAGRVHFLVFDFTNQQSTDASRIEARRLGLGDFFETAGGTGSVVVLDGTTKDVVAWISGIHDATEYSAAVDAGLRRLGS